ncbi:uncharacterized protein LOC125536963 isoform X1 [Triticum urartu]|uniref:uncharacterized protein LOC125536963 isoform X1 n=1 Tax=Triticum urartu TaxID=4572 RepID=UPI0020430666|nr:uncharacterized protein LOC125536963 isoform X1 [Triticum urartu]
MAARVDVGGRGEELARPDTGNGAEVAGSGDSEGAAATSGSMGSDLRGSSGGFHEGMSDLVSPFIVLYEDDADAFWCFEMLLRRMVICIYVKLYWHMLAQGPTGVMKRLEALWKIMELTDTEVTNWSLHIYALRVLALCSDTVKALDLGQRSVEDESGSHQLVVSQRALLLPVTQRPRQDDGCGLGF